MSEGKYDYLFVSGKDHDFHTRSGPVIAHLEHDMLAGAHQYHAHWVPVEPTMAGMKSWDGGTALIPTKHPRLCSTSVRTRITPMISVPR